MGSRPTWRHGEQVHGGAALRCAMWCALVCAGVVHGGTEGRQGERQAARQGLPAAPHARGYARPPPPAKSTFIWSQSGTCTLCLCV